MSGHPNVPQIAELRDALDDVNREREAIAGAQRKKSECERQLVNATERLREASAKVAKLMDAMDCSSPGNFGYENRIFALLTGLAEHAEQYGREHP